jgi:hypothetical protein
VDSALLMRVQMMADQPTISPAATPWAKMPLLNARSGVIRKPSPIDFFQESRRLVAESESLRKGLRSMGFVEL